MPKEPGSSWVFWPSSMRLGTFLCQAKDRNLINYHLHCNRQCPSAFNQVWGPLIDPGPRELPRPLISSDRHFLADQNSVQVAWVTDVYLVVIILLVLMFYWLFSTSLSAVYLLVGYYFFGFGSAHSLGLESGPPKTQYVTSGLMILWWIPAPAPKTPLVSRNVR